MSSKQIFIDFLNLFMGNFLIHKMFGKQWINDHLPIVVSIYAFTQTLIQCILQIEKKMGEKKRN
ncbi:hypothetical protein DERP_006877 [Dermatophagoides pteronyssinus]|uniref:Very-long-chain 3-oxoacyl-CoA synthase n=1 Tax=Dermatophagoides pteronyssinus TaxID=6956 RepID=A0ABQ8IS92_DERPT|nr:hypothetical protein DERP_006877 [Dermatophagoides pteronyssinus]